MDVQVVEGCCFIAENFEDATPLAGDFDGSRNRGIHGHAPEADIVWMFMPSVGHLDPVGTNNRPFEFGEICILIFVLQTARKRYYS